MRQKPGLTNQTFLVVKPGLPDFTICAKSLVDQGIPGTSLLSLVLVVLRTRKTRL